jgi:hypothetical protein
MPHPWNEWASGVQHGWSGYADASRQAWFWSQVAQAVLTATQAEGDELGYWQEERAELRRQRDESLRAVEEAREDAVALAETQDMERAEWQRELDAARALVLREVARCEDCRFLRSLLPPLAPTAWCDDHEYLDAQPWAREGT